MALPPIELRVPRQRRLREAFEPLKIATISVSMSAPTAMIAGSCTLAFGGRADSRFAGWTSRALDISPQEAVIADSGDPEYTEATLRAQESCTNAKGAARYVRPPSLKPMGRLLVAGGFMSSRMASNTIRNCASYFCSRAASLRASWAFD